MSFGVKGQADETTWFRIHVQWKSLVMVFVNEAEAAELEKVRVSLQLD